MKKIMAAALFAAGATSGVAYAADAPLVVVDKETMAFASDTSWSGFYAGIGLTGAFNPGIPETLGFVDGLVGANAQAESFVFGAEAYLSGWISDLAGPGLSSGIAVRGGFLVTPEVLLYVSGGAKHFITGGNNYWQLGGGAEFMVAEDMSVDLEYKHWQQIGGGNHLHSISTSLLWHF